MWPVLGNLADFDMYLYPSEGTPQVNPFNSLLISTAPHPSTCRLRILKHTPNHIEIGNKVGVSQ